MSNTPTLSPEQAFSIVNNACARAAFTLTPPEFLQFLEAMNVLKSAVTPAPADPP
jgi:hypothetical protein